MRAASQSGTLVFLHCCSPERVDQLRLQALGIKGVFARWIDPIPAAPSDKDPCSLNICIPDYRGDMDLVLLRSLPQVDKVEPFYANIVLPNPREVRYQYFQTRH